MSLAHDLELSAHGELRLSQLSQPGGDLAKSIVQRVYALLLIFA